MLTCGLFAVANLLVENKYLEDTFRNFPESNKILFWMILSQIFLWNTCMSPTPMRPKQTTPSTSGMIFEFVAAKACKYLYGTI